MNKTEFAEAMTGMVGYENLGEVVEAFRAMRRILEGAEQAGVVYVRYCRPEEEAVMVEISANEALEMLEAREHLTRMRKGQ